MIYSIGHGGNTPERTLNLMQQHDIAVLVDVRSKPFSRFQPGFNKKALTERLGGRYQWHPELGGLNGNVITEETLDWLVEFGREQHVVIMCSESDPFQCHRHSKIAARLWNRQPPIPVMHLLKEGGVRQAFREGESAPIVPDQPGAGIADLPGHPAISAADALIAATS